MDRALGQIVACSLPALRATSRGITIDVDLRAGREQATIWTNDLSIAYVHENSAYST